jgi:hypothetical protein
VAEAESWKPVPFFPLEASSLGRIRSISRTGAQGLVKGKVLATVVRPYGHTVVSLSVEGRKRTLYAHRLVLLAFEGPCPDGKQACHRNGNATDNRPENLYWGTHAENMADGIRHGTSGKGESSGKAKLTERDVRAIRADARGRRVVAAEYGIHPGHVYAIRRRTFWQHIT